MQNQVDTTEETRRKLTAEINAKAQARAELAAKVGQVWDTSQMVADFEVKAFSAPFCIVTRKSDGVVGSLEFQHAPRFYYNFVPANET